MRAVKTCPLRGGPHRLLKTSVFESGSSGAFLLIFATSAALPSRSLEVLIAEKKTAGESGSACRTRPSQPQTLGIERFECLRIDDDRQQASVFRTGGAVCMLPSSHEYALIF